MENNAWSREHKSSDLWYNKTFIFFLIIYKYKHWDP